jgi:hypothetical protein
MKEERTGWLARIAAIVALGQINIFLTMIAAFVLGAAAIFLTTAWLFGPKIQLERSQYSRFIASSGGRIVESWVALELHQSRIRSPEFWRASAKASLCVVIELTTPAGEAADWVDPGRRAFCGPRLGFNTSYTLAELREIAPGVPFAWPKDDRGFAIPEIRMAPATWQWLESHSAHKFMHSDWPASNELDWLRLELDRPVDQAVVGWSALPALVPLQFDPAYPDRPLPSGTVAKRRAARPNWLAVVLLGGIGLWLWVTGFRLVPQLAGLAPQWRWFVMALPLLTLPTWVDTFDQFLQPMSAQWTTVIADMLSDLDPLDRLEATDVSRALLAGGVKMRWMASAGAYRNTFGRMAPTLPLSHPQDPDSALLALSNAIAERVSSVSAAERVALFAQLRSDKQRDLKAAGIVFLAAAREWRQRSSGTDGRAAAAFLTEWYVSPVEPPDPHGLAFEARKTLSQR